MFDLLEQVPGGKLTRAEVPSQMLKIGQLRLHKVRFLCYRQGRIDGKSRLCADAWCVSCCGTYDKRSSNCGPGKVKGVAPPIDQGEA
jgi:hypothetical protein